MPIVPEQPNLQALHDFRVSDSTELTPTVIGEEHSRYTHYHPCLSLRRVNKAAAPPPSSGQEKARQIRQRQYPSLESVNIKKTPEPVKVTGRKPVSKSKSKHKRIDTVVVTASYVPPRTRLRERNQQTS